MKPVKMPKKIDAFLRVRFGLGFSEGYYQGILSDFPLTFTLHFGKHPPGYLIHIGLHYPVGSGGVQMNPMEASVIYPNKVLAGTPELFERHLFWGANEQNMITGDLDAIIQKWLSILTDANIMLGLYGYLLGLVGEPPAEFSHLRSPHLKRKETVNRLLGKACYLNLIGNYEEAESVIHLINTSMIGEAEKKVLSDSKEKEIRVPKECLDYLLSIGARGGARGITVELR